jgi:hypothetical protein
VTKRGNSEKRMMFGAHLQGLRRRKGMGLKKTAMQMHYMSGSRWKVTPSCLAHWEHGKRIPVQWLPVMASVLEVPREDLKRMAVKLGAPLGGPVIPYQQRVWTQSNDRAKSRSGVGRGRKPVRSAKPKSWGTT